MIKAVVYLLGLCTLAVLVMIGALILCFSNVSWGEYADRGQNLAKAKITEAVKSALEGEEEAADERPEPAEKASAGRHHRVGKGETLFSIAERYYSDGRRWKEIARANAVEDPSRLSVGLRLHIP